MKIQNRGTNSTRNNNSRNILTEKGNFSGKNNLKKKHKRVVYEEESFTEPEVEESEYVPEETEEEIKKSKVGKKTTLPKRKNNIFEYLNNNAKRNKR